MEKELLKIFRKYKIIATGSDQVIIAEIIEAFKTYDDPYVFPDSEE